jgi:DNA invertase Pin-like site-specific DNA recombinase
VLETLRTGDVLVIWKRDRLGRSLTHLLAIVTDLMTRQVGLKSLNDPIDTATPQGRLIVNLFASLAEFEREVVRERTQAGLSAARARGRTGGRPKGIPWKAEATAYAAETLYREGRLSAQGIADSCTSPRAPCMPICARGVPIGTPRGQPRHATHHHTGLGDVGAHQTDLCGSLAGLTPAPGDPATAPP